VLILETWYYFRQAQVLNNAGFACFGSLTEILDGISWQMTQEEVVQTCRAKISRHKLDSGNKFGDKV